MGRSEERRLFRAMRDYGLDIQVTSRGHRAVLQNGKVIAGLPGENGGSDWRSWANSLAEVKRACGFEWRPKQPRKRAEPVAA